MRQLARDHTAGSGELALRACGILERFAPGGARSGKASAAVAERCGQLARAVASAQPSMAAVLNVSSRWLLAVEQGDPVAPAARRLCRELRQAQKAAALRAAGLVTEGAAVVTYSASSTVLGALLASRRRGRRFRVLCSESRPRREGCQLARRLAQSGVPVELFTEAGLFSAMAAADLVMVGCDAILSGYFLNKVGTRALSWMARRSRIPFYVVADSFKFLPRGLEPWFRIRQESAAEIWRARDKNLAVRNFYFEKVPLGDCSAVVTETGVWPPKRMNRFVRQAEIAAGLEHPPERRVSVLG